MKKGQVEFIAILGILVVAVVAVYFAWQGLAPPTQLPALSAEQQVVADAVGGFLREGTQDVLSTMAQNGGYLSADEFPMGSETLNGKPAPYWFYNGRVQVPDFKSTFLRGITAYINNNIDSLRESLSDQEVTFGTPAVSVDVLPGQLTITVNMPTTMKGTVVPQPYQVIVPTKMAEAFEFGGAFVNFEAQNRFLEYATLSSIALSPLKNNIQTVPLWIYLTKCGESVYKSWSDVKDAAKERVEVTLAHTYMPGKVPLNTANTASYPKYALPPVNNKEYADLDVSFFMPDNFDFGHSNFQYTPEIIAFAKPVVMTKYCRSDPLLIHYYLYYPFVTRVKDPLTGNILRFVSQVYIKDNSPGAWAATVSGYETSTQQAICENALCPVKIRVQDTSGNPISRADIEYMGCLLGQTDSSGVLTANAPCGAGTFTVRKSGYSDYETSTDHSQLSDAAITLKKNILVNLHFYVVNIQNVTKGDTEEYWIEPKNTDELGGIDFLNANPERKEVVRFNTHNLDSSVMEQNPVMYTTQTATTRLGAGNYLITGIVTSDLVPMGSFWSNYTIDESLDGGNLYIYLPYIMNYDQIIDSEAEARTIVILSRILERCGIGPVTDAPVTLEALKVARIVNGEVTCS